MARKKGNLRVSLLFGLILGGGLLLFLGGRWAVTQILYPMKHQEFIHRYSAENGLAPEFVAGVIYTESRFREGAISYADARGLMQITKDTFEWAAWRVKDEESSYEDIFDPEVNIRYGCIILRLLKEEFVSDELTLAAYNAGWGNVKKWLLDPQYSDDGERLHTIPFQDTRQYLPNVKKAEKIYRKLYFS